MKTEVKMMQQKLRSTQDSRNHHKWEENLVHILLRGVEGTNSGGTWILNFWPPNCETMKFCFLSAQPEIPLAASTADCWLTPWLTIGTGTQTEI
jgi:hypothetical protein